MARPVLFRVPVAPDAITAGDWPILGNMPLQSALAEPASYRHQPVSSNQLYLYRDGQSHPATREAVKDLELLAVWFDQHIIERPRNHSAGRRDPVTEMFKEIKVYGSDGQELR